MKKFSILILSLWGGWGLSSYTMNNNDNARINVDKAIIDKFLQFKNRVEELQRNQQGESFNAATNVQNIETAPIQQAVPRREL